METAIYEEWNSILQNLIRNVIESMETRCAAVFYIQGNQPVYYATYIIP